ncbi:MAG: calcium-binding protein [Oligoflexia bacterium]|nr:calcium-binding protein [Oligoflexia bacterium]
MVSRAAWAGCPSTPKDWASAACDPGDGYGDACSASGPTTAATWTCTVAKSSVDADGTTVSDTSGDLLYSWGSRNDKLFCCPAPGNYTYTTVIIDGSEYDDLLSFHWTSGPDDLADISPTARTGLIYGAGGADLIHGSYETDSSYSETLSGDGGSDTIYGHPGDDTIYGGDKRDTCDGGAGDDTIYGEAGADNIFGGRDKDTIYGGTEDDVIRGGDGDDTINGDKGNDRIDGGPGDDTIDGGPGGDVICGGSETTGDTISDGGVGGTITPANQIWAANALDSIACTASNTLTNPGSDASPFCNETLTDKPAQCP